MLLTISCPSRTNEKLKVDIKKSASVSKLRQLTCELLDVPIENIRLFAKGKILEDYCADGSVAQLFLTYGISDSATILCQIRQTDTAEPEIEETESQLEELDVAPSEPFEPYDCKSCNNDDSITRCIECGCQHCLLKTGDPLICDQCEGYWHLECLGLDSVPQTKDWYCPQCINTDVDKVISLGKKVDMRASKSARTPAAKQKKAWGGGVSCSGRQNECHIVPKTHVGKIPGVYCGQSWEYRLTCSEWGVHRSSVAGIAGATATGAVSIVLSSGYPDDKDGGMEFLYTGSGGRDLKGNKRTGSHERDQELTFFNLALARTCAAEVNAVTGAEAKNWKESRPVRVCRSAKLARHNPQYAPKEGIRYDGLYKIVKYWPEKGAEGFKVWRFKFRRDDPEPAPWTPEGLQLIKKHGLRLIKHKTESEKLKKYEIPASVRKLMKADTADKRIWDSLASETFWSEYEFLHHLFTNVIVCSSGACPAPIADPVTTPCGHIICSKCLRRPERQSCFTCRSDLSAIFEKESPVNQQLVAILKALNPAYGVDTSLPLPSITSKKKEPSTPPTATRASKRQKTSEA